MPAILGLRKKPKLMKPKMRFNKISIKVRLHRGYYKLLRTILFIGLIFILLYPVIYIFTTSNSHKQLDYNQAILLPFSKSLAYFLT